MANSKHEHKQNQHGNMYLRISKTKRHIRVAEDSENFITLELETQGETTCFKYIADDLLSMGMSAVEADRWADKFVGLILLRGVTENLFEELEQ